MERGEIIKIFDMQGDMWQITNKQFRNLELKEIRIAM